MTDTEQRIFQILEYLNKSQVRNNSKLTVETLRNQFSFAKKDFDEAFAHIKFNGLIYRREGTNGIAISRDGEVKFNELYARVKSKETNAKPVIPKTGYHLSPEWAIALVTIVLVLIGGAFTFGFYFGNFKFDQDKIDMERRVKECEDQESVEIKTLNRQIEDCLKTYQTQLEEIEKLKKQAK